VDEYMNEQEQWEYVRNWIRQNGAWLLAGVVLASAGLWGWRSWQAHREAMLLEAGEQYRLVLAAMDRNDVPAVIAAADKLSAAHPRTGYAEQGQLAAARMQVENNQLPGALTRLQKVESATRDDELKLVVRLRIARLQIEQNRSDDALATLNAVQPGAFAGRFAEVRGDALLAKGDRSGALKAYREAQAAQAAQSVQSGAAAAAGGGGDHGGDLLELKINALTRS
jgi:predicted negative regulator of RcsB-dependent stress response